jgi:ribosomal protein L29
MANIHDDPAALKALQDDIYRERILRARQMTVEQRLADALELTNSVFARMHEGAMWQLGTTDAELGWQEVRRRLARLDRVHEEGRFVNTKPGSA